MSPSTAVCLTLSVFCTQACAFPSYVPCIPTQAPTLDRGPAVQSTPQKARGFPPQNRNQTLSVRLE